MRLYQEDFLKCKKHTVKFHLDCEVCVAMIYQSTWNGNSINETISFMLKKGFIFINTSEIPIKPNEVKTTLQLFTNESVKQ